MLENQGDDKYRCWYANCLIKFERDSFQTWNNLIEAMSDGSINNENKQASKEQPNW